MKDINRRDFIKLAATIVIAPAILSEAVKPVRNEARYHIWPHQRLTLVEMAKNCDPGLHTAKIAEILNRPNELLNDLSFQ